MRAFRTFALAALLVVAACASDDGGSASTSATSARTAPDTRPPSGATTTTGPTTIEPASTDAVTTTAPLAPQLPAVRPECTPGPGRTIVEIPDQVTEPIVVAPVSAAAVADGDEEIPAVEVPGFTIDAQTLDGGCIIYHDAPGGCIGAVEVSGIEIPAVRIPGVRVDAVTVDGERVSDEIRVAEVVIPGSTAPGARVEQDCTIQPASADRPQPALVRPEVVRRGLGRREGFRAGGRRPELCLGDQCVGEVVIPDVIVPTAGIADAVVPEQVVLVEEVTEAPGTQVIETDAQTSYTAPVDVLFDVDQATLRPEAGSSLQAIADALNASPGAAVVVEGHTDSDGETAYNDDLSQRRADAVRAWLVDQGGIPAERITTIGRGESLPAADNGTAEGRALNRRVVVSLLNG